METNEEMILEAPEVLTTGEPAPVRTADVLVDLLVEYGVDVVFGLPGGAIAPLHDALLGRPSIRVITTRHESGAMFAAAAYARATGKLGVVLVTSGPGVTNALTGLASAHCDGLPVLLLAGEVPRPMFGRKALQEGTSDHLNVVGMATPISKLALRVNQPDAAPATLRRAIETALTTRRGPVLVTLPMDVTSIHIQPPHISTSIRLDNTPPGATLARVASILSGAERPILFAGSGCRWDDGPIGLRAIAEALQCPVMTTPKGKGVFPESHPLSLGVFGLGGHPSASAYLRGGVDVVCAIGTGLSDTATDGWSPLLAARKHFVQIDADALQLGRNYPVTLGVVGTAGRVLADLAGRLGQLRRAPQRFGVAYHEDPALAIPTGPDLIPPHRALWELQQVLPPDTLYTCDIGEHLIFALHYLTIDRPEGFITMSGLGSMGASIGAAMGMQLAHPDRPVAALCGDGCFAMAMSDVSTAAQERLPLIIAVLNDERYGMVELGHQTVFGKRPSYPTGPMNVPRLARALGAQSIVVSRPGEILGLDLRPRDRPLVLDIRIDREARMPRNARNEAFEKAVTQPLKN